MKQNFAYMMGGIFLLAGCASTYHRGVVAMKVDSRVAHVGINKTEVLVGDHVELFANKCTRIAKDNPGSCQKVQKGHGTVTEILGDNYVSVKFDEGVAFDEGDFIEKHNH